MNYLKDILRDLEGISLSIPNVNTFKFANVEDVINIGSLKYAAILTVFEDCRLDLENETAEYRFTLFYNDLDIDNTVDIQSHGTQVVYNILSQLAEKYQLGQAVTVRPFERRNAALASGVFAEFTVITENQNGCKF